jgi:NhaA family Na+:H+ antiporter
MDRREDLEKDLSEGKIDSTELRRRLNHFSRNLQSLSHRLVADLHIAVTFLVMPLFAFCNTAIRLDYEAVTQFINPISMGIFIGLFIGKPFGVLSFSWLTIRMGWARRPIRTPWTMMVGASLLAGIGFTMSFFLSVLAFPQNVAFQNNAKMAILFASILAACTGFFWLQRATSKTKQGLKVS